MKPEALYSEKLAWFKQNEKPEVVLVIADNVELIKIAVAWTNLEVHSTAVVSILDSRSENEIWKWLWENTSYSLTELKEKAGVRYTESVLVQKMQPLIGNRILYPDGTINSFVQRYLREKVIRLFETKRKKQIQE